MVTINHYVMIVGLKGVNMQELCCDVWDIIDPNSMLCILTNNTVLSNGKNIMGGGIAKEALVRNPDLNLKCAQCIKDNKYILGNDLKTGAILMRFPTKNNVWEDSELELIADSLYHLKKYAIQNPNLKIYLPRPGCGLGGLDWEDVKELCESYLRDLDNVYIVSK